MKQALHYKNIILKHRKSIVGSRSECDISQKLGDRTFACPVIMSNMKSVQTVDILRKFDQRNWFYVYHRIDGVDDIYNFVKIANDEDWGCTSISVGIQQSDCDLVRKLHSDRLAVDFFTIDVALSYTDSVKNIIQTIKYYYPDSYIICGNGTTPQWIEFLEKQGVQCAKAGVGTSTSCRTRQYTGFGSPVVTMLTEISEAAENIQIIADGGLTVTNDEIWIGDIAKAIRFGADFVMSGALFSRCVDSPAILSGYYGNASKAAKGHRKHVEGTTLDIRTNGLTIEEQMDLIEDSLRSAVSYAGGKDLSALKTVDYYIVGDQ
jgi:GMP reductase